MSTTRRALHFVFRIGDRRKTIEFYQNVLGMKTLRHEEFEGGCKASCNGPYDGNWSKTMIGYGPEDTHFVVELTYNYGLGHYELGNDFQGITIHSKQAVINVKELKWPFTENDGVFTVEAPDGYKFFLHDIDAEDPVKEVALASSNIQNSLEYWVDRLGMTLFEEADKSAIIGFGEDQCKLRFVGVEKVNHAKAYGRFAFSCPKVQLPMLEHSIKGAGYEILTPLVSLDTPGKVTVEAVILADPDGHEICFVEEEGFTKLSQIDPNAEELLQEALNSDKSDEWFAGKGKSKKSA